MNTKLRPDAGPSLLLKHIDLDREVWIKWDSSAEVYELFASEAGDDYIGCADDRAAALRVAREWFAELMNEGL